jgi:hypothetical protein
VKAGSASPPPSALRPYTFKSKPFLDRIKAAADPFTF